MDSLYVRFKFGMKSEEFRKLALQHPKLNDLEFDGGVELFRIEAWSNGQMVPAGTLYKLTDRHKFLDWARNSGLYDEKSLDDLEWLICQEMMKELQ